MIKQSWLFTFYFLLFMVCIMPVQAQVSADNNVAASAQPAGNSNTITITGFNVPAGNNVALIITYIGGNFREIANINFNGNNYTSNSVGTGAHGSITSQIWAIPLGDIGSALNGQTITLTLTGATLNRGAAASTYTNVDQTIPANNFVTENIGDLSIDVNSSSGGMVVDLIAGSTQQYTVGMGQTTLADNAFWSSSNRYFCTSYESSSGASVNMNWTQPAGGTNWLHVGANIRAVGSLPVEMTNFKAWQSEDNVELAWTTASEVNNEGFEIEHKAADTGWRYLGFVPGSGTSFEEQSYSYLHTAPLHGLHYYRLKQLDFDGANEYSPIVSVDLTNFENLSNLKIFPNPAQSGELTLSLPDTDLASGNLELFDALGQLILRQTVSHSNTQLNVRQLPSGVYWLKVNANGQTMQEKVVVQH